MAAYHARMLYRYVVVFMGYGHLFFSNVREKFCAKKYGGLRVPTWGLLRK